MKIMQIIPSFGMGGGEIMCENLCVALRNRGHEITPVSLYTMKTTITDRLEAQGFKIQYLDKHSGFDANMFGRLKKVIRAQRPDVIHTHLNVSLYAFPVAKSCGIKNVVHTVHSIATKEQPKSIRMLQKYYFKKKKYVPIALSESVQGTIVVEYGIEESKVPVILNGVDLSKCIPKTTYEYGEKYSILHIGRFSSPKNHIGLLEAFREFHSKYPATELILVGDGELRAEIENEIKNKGLSDCVVLKGLQKNVYPLLNAADLFTLPSNYEGVPMTLIEAMGTGLPIVSTLVGGIPDMLENNVNALLTEVDSSTIAEAFEKYYLSQELREQYGRKAKERSVAFSSTVMAQKYEEVYLSVVK